MQIDLKRPDVDCDGLFNGNKFQECANRFSKCIDINASLAGNT